MSLLRPLSSAQEIFNLPGIGLKKYGLRGWDFAVKLIIQIPEYGLHIVGGLATQLHFYRLFWINVVLTAICSGS